MLSSPSCIFVSIRVYFVSIFVKKAVRVYFVSIRVYSCLKISVLVSIRVYSCLKTNRVYFLACLFLKG